MTWPSCVVVAAQDRRGCVKLLPCVGSSQHLPVLLQGLFSIASGDSWQSTSYNTEIKSHFTFPQGLMSLGQSTDIPILPHYPLAVSRSLSTLPHSPGTADLGCLQVPCARLQWSGASWHSTESISLICSCLEWPMGTAWTICCWICATVCCSGFQSEQVS